MGLGIANAWKLLKFGTPILRAAGFGFDMIQAAYQNAVESHGELFRRTSMYSASTQIQGFRTGISQIYRDIQYSRDTEFSAIRAEKARNAMLSSRLPLEIRAANVSNRINEFTFGFADGVFAKVEKFAATVDHWTGLGDKAKGVDWGAWGKSAANFAIYANPLTMPFAMLADLFAPKVKPPNAADLAALKAAQANNPDNWNDMLRKIATAAPPIQPRMVPRRP